MGGPTARMAAEHAPGPTCRTLPEGSPEEWPTEAAWVAPEGTAQKAGRPAPETGDFDLSALRRHIPEGYPISRTTGSARGENKQPPVEDPRNVRW